MRPENSKRKTVVYCPKCGHANIRVRTCDAEIECKRCGYKYEAVIGPNADRVSDSGEKSYGEPDPPNAH